MQGDKRIDKLMLPVLNAINRHVKDIDAKTDIYNRAYEAVMISMVVKTSTTGVKTPESIENPWIPVSEGEPNEDGICWQILTKENPFIPDCEFYYFTDGWATDKWVTHYRKIDLPLPPPPDAS